LPLDKNTEQVENVQSYRRAHSHCYASRPITIAKVKTLTRGSGLGFDLLISGPVHAEVLPTLVLIA